jgi:L-fuculose-phosphate aldolase
MDNHPFQSHFSSLLSVCHRAAAKGYVVATDGNLSLRLPDGNILITPTSVPKDLLIKEDLIVISPAGEKIEGTRFPSTESGMHLFIYHHRADIEGVVHCHPVYATAFAAAGLEISSDVLPEVHLGLGRIPLAPYATPSTDEVAESIAPFIKQAKAILLANHGVVTFGKNVQDAMYLMEKVEQAAHILFLARMLGGERHLSTENLQKLKEVWKLQYDASMHQ